MSGDGAGLLLTPPGLGEQPEAQAWAGAQIHHNLSWRQRGCGEPNSPSAQGSFSKAVLLRGAPPGVTCAMVCLSLQQAALHKPTQRRSFGPLPRESTISAEQPGGGSKCEFHWTK